MLNYANQKELFFLPTTKKELEYIGWEQPDIIIISGDAYVDHPSFGTAVIARVLYQNGYKVAIVPQPNWQDDLRDFKKLGPPKLFFGITSGNMDSMVNHYTANKRLRSNDAYTAGGKAGFRPDYATNEYAKIVKSLFPDVPIVLGGIEASMRRLSHYDYWSDSLKPSILIDSKADILVYGMGERPILAVAKAIKNNDWRSELKDIPQIAYSKPDIDSFTSEKDILLLHPYEEELKNKKFYAENFVYFERESNKIRAKTLIQSYKNQYIIVNPPYAPPTEEEMDSFALFDQMMNLPHPKYAKRGDIPAYEMIKNSITLHRGCFGGCSFCAIAAHQGKQVSSRSETSILEEVRHLTQRPYFKGHITDLGGPSANMYKMAGMKKSLCERCERPSCLFPEICVNLNYDHAPLIELYRKSRLVNRIKHITIGSGIRYDMLLSENENIKKKYHIKEYLDTILRNHVSGRLKVAPEHSSNHVLKRMRKPPFVKFIYFLNQFTEFNKKSGKFQQLIPYFISSHPGCTKEDMAELAKKTEKYNLFTEQVQEFTPTPMTYATAMFYLGYDPYSGEKVYSAKTLQEKKEQHIFFFNRPTPHTSSSQKKYKSR